MAKNNIGVISPEEVEKIFDDKWYNGVQKAIDLVLDNCESLGLDPEEVIHNITDYNITKRLHEQVLVNLIDRLPKILYWEDSSQLEIFDEFKELIDSCVSCENFKTYSVKIHYDGSLKTLYLLRFLKAVVNRDYEELHVDIIPHKAKNKLTLKITRL